jgi:hypothetical protein
VSLTFATPPPVITTTSLPGGIAGQAYPSQTLAAEWGTAPLTFSKLNGTLPPGLSLSTDGVISGTPTAPGDFSFTAEVTDDNGRTGTQNLSISITSALAITTTSLPGAVVGSAYSQPLAASGGIKPYTWTLSDGSLPPGLGISADGTISGTPTGSGDFSFTVKVTDSEGTPVSATQALSIQVGQAPVFTADTPPLTAGTGTPYSYQFTASGTPAPAFTLGGGAPSWLTIDATTGQVTGTPPAGTTSFTYSVTASSSAGSVTTQVFTVTVSNKADITAQLSCPASLGMGRPGTCTLTVTNAGPALATGVTASARVPSQLHVTGCSGGCSPGNLPAWSLGSLAAGHSATLTITVLAVQVGTAQVTATAGAASPDPDQRNNSTLVTVRITL